MKKISLFVVVLVLISSILSIKMRKHLEDVEFAVELKSVSRVSLVESTQRKLKDLGYYNGNIDGVYGIKTITAVKKFQRDNKLKVDGVVGEDTAKALGIRINGENNKTRSSDIELLAKCVYGEARGEPYIGMVAVASVVLNRVKSPQFPNTIAGVVYQPLAFTAVNDGQINLIPNQTAYNAAKDALNGWDPTNGCIYYYNPKTATSKWIFQKPVYLQIGNHNFCV